MILRSLTVQNWRCFVEPLTVGPFSEGLNVIYGPNGVGKSTLMMALVRGLFDSHNVKAEAIQTLRPWGRQLAPRVTIEFEQDGAVYRLEKQFLDSPSAVLSRKEGSRFVRLAEARAADNQARQILAGELPGRGATDHRHWGLAQILWATQGHLQIDQLSFRTQTAIRQSLGAQLTGQGADALEKRINDLFNECFTPSGKLRSGKSAPRVVQLQKDLEEYQKQKQQLEQQLEEFEEASRRIEDLRCRVEQAEREEKALAEELTKARQKAKEYDRLLADKKLHKREVEAAEQAYEALKHRIDRIAELRKALDTARQQIQRLEEAEPALRKQLEQAERQQKQAEERVAAARAARKQALEAQKKARVAQRYLQNKQQVEKLDKLLAEIDKAEQELAELRQQRRQIVAPDAQTLSKIRKAARMRDEARLQLDAAVITVRIEPEAPVEVDVIVAEEPGQRTLAPDATAQIKGSPDVAFRLPGVGRFEATGPTRDAEELRKKWQRACEELERLTAGFGTKDLKELEQLHNQAEALDRKIDQVNERVKTLLSGRDAESIRLERTHAARAVEEVLQDFPEWADAPPDAEALSAAAEQIEQEVEDQIQDREHELGLAQKAVASAREAMVKHQTELQHAKQDLEDKMKQLTSLCSDGKTDDERKKQLTQHAMERDAAKGRLQEVEEKLEKFEGDPSELVRQLEGQVEAVREQAAQARDQLKTEEGRIQQLANEAPYSKLARVEEAIGRLERDIAEQQLQLDAIRLLHDVLQEEKRRALDSVLDPVRQRATRTLQRIAGRRFEDIRFGDGLLPQGITPRAVEKPASLDQISGGEREQVHFAVRLALAEVAFPAQRQLLVLDDVFTYTDTARLARVAKILDEAAERFQILLLTCHPERYRALANAQFFDLEALASRRGGAT